MEKNNKKGFTLVEILAALVIISIVSVIAMTAVIPRIAQSKKEKFLMDAQNIIKTGEGLFLEQQIKNNLPSSAREGEINGITLKFTDGTRTEPIKNYIISLETIKKYIEIEEDYQGWVLAGVDKNGNATTYLNLVNDEYALASGAHCKTATVTKYNKCFYSKEKISNNNITLKDGMIPYRQTQITKENISKS